MGYRSDVRIVVSKEGYELLKEFVEYYLKDNVKKEEINEMNLLKSVDIKTEGKNQVYLGWNYLKWYDGYNEIDAVMKGLEYLKDKDMSYRYARIGEDFTDFEEDNYDSKTDNLDLSYPAVERYFDDSYFDGVEEEPKPIKKKEDKER